MLVLLCADCTAMCKVCELCCCGVLSNSDRFIVREFQFNEQEIAEEKRQKITLESHMKDQWGSLVRLLRVDFGDVFSAWMHLKVIRIFIESVLRYGIPPVYMTMLVHSQKSIKKVQQELSALVASPELNIPGMSLAAPWDGPNGGGSKMHRKNKGSNGGSSSYAFEDAGHGASDPLTLEFANNEYYPYVFVEVRWTMPAS